MGPSLLRALLHRATVSSESDAELIGRFAATRDEAAFTELVRRYCGLVWGQCRHLLLNEADAEDAFQATFLVLARRPEVVRTAVGPYLHGVAYRVCLNARRLAGRRKKHEVSSATSEASYPVADSAWDAALAAVHGEIHRLPEPQRVAFVLCVLEGRGLTEVATSLGVKLGTLSARLSRAKQAVMQQLTSKGVLAGMATVAALGGGTGVASAVAERAVQSAVGAVNVPAAVHTLTHGVVHMLAYKLKVLAAAVILACGLGLGVGSGWIANAQDTGAKAPPVAALPKVAKPATPSTEFKYVPVPNNQFATAAEFEKQVKTMESDGYKFVGSVPMVADKKLPAGVKATVVPTMVFRRVPVVIVPGVAAAKPKPDLERLYTVNFENAPWSTVEEWLANEIKLTCVDNAKLLGTCTLKSNRKLTLGELMDTLNEMLASQKKMFIRGQQILRVWPTDKPLPQLYVPPASLEELPGRGKTEVVSVVIRLGDTPAADAEKLAKKLKSPIGEVILIGREQLVVRDKAGSVLAIAAALGK